MKIEKMVNYYPEGVIISYQGYIIDYDSKEVFIGMPAEENNVRGIYAAP